MSIYDEDGDRGLVSPAGVLAFLAYMPPDTRKQGKVTQAYWLGVHILRLFFGPDWLDRYVLKPKPNTFFAFDEDDLRSYHIHQLRVITLAEMIFNMQRMSGLDNPLSQVKSGGIHIESGYSELEVGKLLMMFGIAFRYVTPRGERGDNYDVELFHPNGQLIRADIKCKLERSELGTNTIRNTLADAYDQVPPDEPGMLIVKVPQDWMLAEGFREQFDAQAQLFFNGTTKRPPVRRIVSVVAIGSLLLWEPGVYRSRLTGSEFISENHKFMDPRRNWRMLSLYDHTPNVPLGWLALADLFPTARLEPPYGYVGGHVDLERVAAELSEDDP
jgi:hypothetical protein